MRNPLFLFAMALPLALAAVPALAGDVEHEEHIDKMVVALKTDDFELAETDISHLGVGDAETVYTEDGRAIDILRTEDGVEIYVDGERLDLGDPGMHAEHREVHKHIEVICAEDGDCEEMAWSSEDVDLDVGVSGGDGHEKTIIVVREREEAE